MDAAGTLRLRLLTPPPPTGAPPRAARREDNQLIPWTENSEISNITRTSPALA